MNKELANQEQHGPRIYSDFFFMSGDFFFMSGEGVPTPMVPLKFIRSGRMAVKFFAGFIQQTGVQMFINKSDGEPAMKAVKDAAAKAAEGAEVHKNRHTRPPCER